MAVKNVVFRFTADTSQLQRVIDNLNKSIAGAQKTLSNIKFRVNTDSVNAEYKKLIGADNEYKRQAIAAAKQIKKENEAAAKELTASKKNEYNKIIAADNEYKNKAIVAAKEISNQNEIVAKKISTDKKLQYDKIISADDNYKKQAIDAAKKIKSENEAVAKQLTKDKQNEYKKLIAADNEYKKQAIANANQIRKEAAQLAKQQAQEAARAVKSQRITPIAAAPGVGFGDIVKGGLATFGIVATVDALVQLSKETVQAAIDFERLTASFRALIGDKTRADQAIKDIQKFALETPFDVTQVAAAAKTLLGYGISVNNLIPTLQQLGDVSAASGGDIQRVALAFGQVAAKGKLQGEEIRQLVNIGFNPLQEISQRTGESMAALAKRVEAGQVSFEEVAMAFKTATEEGGRFFELSKTLTDTFGGQIQKLGEQIGLFQIQLGGIVSDELRPLVESLNDFFKNLADSTKAVRDNALTLGIWKASLGFIIGLLAKSANLWLLNTSYVGGFSKILRVINVSFALTTRQLQRQNLLLETSATSTKTAAVATNIYNTSLKGVAFATNIVAAATKSLWGLIASNPIGLLIAGYTLINALLERKQQLNRQEFLDTKGLIDINNELRISKEKLVAQQKTSESSITAEFNALTRLIKARGTESKEVIDAVAKFGEKYNLQLGSILNTKEEQKAVSALTVAVNNLIQAESKRLAVKQKEADIATAQEDLSKAQAGLTASQKRLIREQKLVEDLRKEYNNLQNISGGATGGVQTVVPAKSLSEAEARFKTASDEAQNYGKNVVDDTAALKKLKKELEDLNFELLGFGDAAGEAAAKSNNYAKALENLLKYIQKLKDELIDLQLKTLEFDISILPTVTEENQIQKAEAVLNFAKSEADKLKQVELDGLNERLDELKAANASDLEIEAFKAKGKIAIGENYYQRVLLAERKFDNEFLNIRKDFREEDLKNLRKYTDDAIDYLKKLKEQETELLTQRLETTRTEFEGAPIGQGKKYKERLQQERLAVLESFRQTSELNNKERDIQAQRDREAIDKKYKYEKTAEQLLFDQGIPLTAEQEKKRLRDNETEQKQLQEKNNALRTLDQKYYNDKELQRLADLKRQQGFEEEANKLDEEARIARLNRIYDNVKAEVDAAFTIANAAIDAEIMKNDKLIELQQQRVEDARKIADQGNAILLEAEEKRLTELQKKRAKFVRAQQALIFAQTAAESVLAVARAAAQGGGALSPILVASTIATLVTGFLAAKAASKSAIEGFDKGGWTGNGGRLEPAGIVHKEEFVVKKGPAAKFRPLLEEINRGRDPFLAAGVGQQVIMINNVGVEDRLNRIEKAIIGQDRMQLTIDESGIHGIVSHYQWKNQRIRNRAK